MQKRWAEKLIQNQQKNENKVETIMKIDGKSSIKQKENVKERNL